MCRKDTTLKIIYRYIIYNVLFYTATDKQYADIIQFGEFVHLFL